MPRYRRQIAPGSVQHVISRFVDNEFRFAVDGAREEYLRRVALVIRRSDWRAIAFTLMSSHAHWSFVAGTQPSSAIMKPLNSGFAGWLNAREGRRGPVFADRHRSVTIEGRSAGITVAYVHNNPVRAGLVADPATSRWSSHRYYVGLEPPPPWLDVELGLSLCGFASDAAGRAAFHRFVLACSGQPRRAELAGDDLARRRRAARSRTASPVEIAAPTVSIHPAGIEIATPIVVPAECRIRSTWNGPTHDVLRATARVTGVSVERMCSRSRAREVARARRLALVTWTRALSRPTVQLARALGIAESSAAELVAAASPDMWCAAAALADVVQDAAADEPAPDAPLLPTNTTADDRVA